MISQHDQSDALFITGASGFVGRHLLDRLRSERETKIRVLSRGKRVEFGDKVQVVQGDLLKTEDVETFIDGPGVLVNIAYLAEATSEENEKALRDLIRAAHIAGVRRILHCSTAVVVGRDPSSEVTESTPAQPFGIYEQKKVRLEEILCTETPAEIDVFILRPTAVFGVGGKNVVKLVRDRAHRPAWKNYVFDCLYDERRLNLVSVEFVTDAILHFARCPIPESAKKPVREAIILSMDDAPENNYRFLSELTNRHFKLRPSRLKPFPLSGLLPFLLKVLGRSNFNPNRRYLSVRMGLWDFKSKRSFAEDLDKFIGSLA